MLVLACLAIIAFLILNMGRIGSITDRKVRYLVVGLTVGVFFAAGGYVTFHTTWNVAKYILVVQLMWLVAGWAINKLNVRFHKMREPVGQKVEIAFEGLVYIYVLLYLILFTLPIGSMLSFQ